MTLTEQIDDFTAFAKLLAQQEGADISLDDAFQQWKEIDPAEVAILQQRLDAYDAGERGRPAAEVMAELREKLIAKYSK